MLFLALNATKMNCVSVSAVSSCSERLVFSLCSGNSLGMCLFGPLCQLRTRGQMSQSTSVLMTVSESALCDEMVPFIKACSITKVLLWISCLALIVVELHVISCRCCDEPGSLSGFQKCSLFLPYP